MGQTRVSLVVCVYFKNKKDLQNANSGEAWYYQIHVCLILFLLHTRGAVFRVVPAAVGETCLSVSGHQAHDFPSPPIDSHRTVFLTRTATPHSGTRSSRPPEMPTLNTLKTTILSGVTREPSEKSTML